MADLAKLKINVDMSEVEAATAALERLVKAAKEAEVALHRLSDVEHGGLKINAVGDVFACDVQPRAESMWWRR